MTEIITQRQKECILANMDSVFDKKTDVTAQTAGQHFFETVASVIDEIVQALAAGMPVTGDPGSLMGWAALLAATLVAM